jgi:putative toxin-antitoxin system antitoxin component (TIGR02293 family)
MAHAALDTFGDEQKAKSWLTTPNPVLNNQEPVQLARTADGARRVEEVLTRIDYGMFS